MRGPPNVAFAEDATGAESTVRVRLVAPLTLLSETVAAALRTLGPEVEELRGGRTGARGVRAAARDAGVLLLVDDLATAEDVTRALTLVSRVPSRVLVLTAHERGRHWGALLAAGAASVLSSSSSLDQVQEALAAVNAGEPDRVLDEQERARLVEEWRAYLREQRSEAARLATLSTRERVVLGCMRAGASVPEMSEQLGVAETTVRSQVKSILRKLGVRSQLAAVALVHRQECPLVAGALAVGPRPGRAAAGGH